ncbi:hypothetical protein V6N13_107262 [Hibiscus sabdariffa]
MSIRKELHLKRNGDRFHSTEHGISRVHFASMLTRDWEVRFEGVNLECNMVADRLVKAVNDLPLEYHRFLDPPLFVVEVLNADALVES